MHTVTLTVRTILTIKSCWANAASTPIEAQTDLPSTADSIVALVNGCSGKCLNVRHYLKNKDYSFENWNSPSWMHNLQA